MAAVIIILMYIHTAHYYKSAAPSASVAKQVRQQLSLSFFLSLISPITLRFGSGRFYDIVISDNPGSCKCRAEM